MRRLLLPLLALVLCQPAAAATAAGPARHGRAGRPEGLPDRVGEGPPAEGLAEVAAAGVNVLKVGPAGAGHGRSRAHDRREPRGGVARALDLGEPERVRANAAWRLARVAAPPCRRHAGGRSVRERDRTVEGRRRALALPDAAGIASLCVLPGDRARLVRRPHAGRHRPALGHRPGAARRVWSLAPYSEVTDIHGVNSYPIAIGDPDPDLGEPGRGRTSSASPRRGARCGRRSGSAGRGATTRPATSSCRRASSSAS